METSSTDDGHETDDGATIENPMLHSRKSNTIDSPQNHSNLESNKQYDKSSSSQPFKANHVI